MTCAIKSVELGNGMKLPYAEQGDTRGVPLVLLHGFAGSWRDFRLVLPHLPESIHTVVPTQRGHGDASKPAHGYRVRDFAADVTAFLEALGIESALLVGASSGGFVARRFVIDHPERARGLVLLGTPATLRGKPIVKEMWETTISGLTDPVDPAFVREFAEKAVAPTVADDLVEEMIEQALKVPARVWRETNRGLLEDDALGELERITTPTLIIWGDEDPVSPRTDQETLVAAIPRSRLVIYRGAGHTFIYEEPERVAADVVAFVDDELGLT